MTLPRSQHFARMARWHEGLALYLASRAGGFVCGSTVMADGGLATTGYFFETIPSGWSPSKRPSSAALTEIPDRPSVQISNHRQTRTPIAGGTWLDGLSCDCHASKLIDAGLITAAHRS
jgi:hypothetical protein